MSSKLVPVALSSQLDVSGEERIHAAVYAEVLRDVFTPYSEDEAFFAYFIADVLNAVSRVGYSRVDLLTGQHTVVASRDYARFAAVHEGGIATNDSDTIFVAGAEADNRLEALQISGAALTPVATWDGIGDPFQYHIAGIAADGNTVFILNRSYNGVNGDVVLRALEFTGTAFTETAAITLFTPSASRIEGSQILLYGEYLVVHLVNVGLTPSIRIVRFDGSFTETDSTDFWETNYTESPFLSTDGAYIAFAGSPTVSDADSVWLYSLDVSGQLVQETGWILSDVGPDIEGAIVNENHATVRELVGSGMWLHSYDKTGLSVTTPSKFLLETPSFQPWTLGHQRSLLYAPTGLEWLNVAIGDDYWFDDATPYRDPARNSGVFDLSKSFVFEEWGNKTETLPIPNDSGATYAESIITVVGQTGTTCRAAVQLSITHPFYGDVRAELVAPDGQVSYLMFANGSTQSLYNEHYASYPLPSSINGVWKLRVYDMFSGVNSGTLNSWSVGLVPAVLQSSLILHITGEDNFSRLEAGFITQTAELL